MKPCITKPCIVFSCDWESRGNYDPHHLVDGKDCFEEISSEIIDISKQLIGGKMVWYCKIDFYADITYYNDFEALSKRILANGGQLGVHIHHISKESGQRKKLYRWAYDRMKAVGFPVTTYSAGMGEVYVPDAGGLLEAGFKSQRGAFPFIKHELCDWMGADLWPGYVNVCDYKRVKTTGELFTYAVGGDEENGNGFSQLHINRYIPLQKLKELFDKHIDFLIGKDKFPCIGCYFHPYNLVSKICANMIDSEVIKKWELFSRWLEDNGVAFITDSEAEKSYLANKGVK